MFKDSWARGEIRQLWEEIGTALRWQERLSERVAELERHQCSELVEKSCPTCGRLTLMKKQAALVEYDPEASNDGLLLARYKTVRPEGFYCYSCGGTFRESTKAVLEEVKEGHGQA